MSHLLLHLRAVYLSGGHREEEDSYSGWTDTDPIEFASPSVISAVGTLGAPVATWSERDHDGLEDAYWSRPHSSPNPLAVGLSLSRRQTAEQVSLLLPEYVYSIFFTSYRR